MRYAVLVKGIPIEKAEAELIKIGAINIKTTRLMRQLFCEMDEEKAKVLTKVPGLAVKLTKEYRADQVVAEPPSVETLSDVFYLLRSYFSPPLTGTGLTVLFSTVVSAKIISP